MKLLKPIARLSAKETRLGVHGKKKTSSSRIRPAAINKSYKWSERDVKIMSQAIKRNDGIIDDGIFINKLSKIGIVKKHKDTNTRLKTMYGSIVTIRYVDSVSFKEIAGYRFSEKYVSGSFFPYVKVTKS
jgi:hypothetical protein